MLLTLVDGELKKPQTISAASQPKQPLVCCTKAKDRSMRALGAKSEQLYPPVCVINRMEGTVDSSSIQLILREDCTQT